MFYLKSQKTRSELENRFLEDCVTVGLIVEPDYLIDKIHADFAIPEKQIAIEIDSKKYHSSEEQRQNDYLRDEIYFQAGWKVIRINGSALMRDIGESIAYEIKRGRFDDRQLSYVVNPFIED